MKTKTTAEIKAVPGIDALPWAPTFDNGVTVPHNGNGQKYRHLYGGAQVPLLIGTVANEAMLFYAPLNNPTLDTLLYTNPELKPYESKLRAAYPTGGCSLTGCWPTARHAAAQALTDYFATCVAAREALSSVHAGTPTWRYYYNVTSGGDEQVYFNSVIHGAEITAIFKTYDPALATRDQKSVSDVIQKAWADFAKDPHDGPGWPAYSGTYDSKIANFDGKQTSNTPSFLNLQTVDAYCSIYGDALYDTRDPNS